MHLIHLKFPLCLDKASDSRPLLRDSIVYDVLSPCCLILKSANSAKVRWKCLALIELLHDVRCVSSWYLFHIKMTNLQSLITHILQYFFQANILSSWVDHPITVTAINGTFWQGLYSLWTFAVFHCHDREGCIMEEGRKKRDFCHTK